MTPAASFALIASIAMLADYMSRTSPGQTGLYNATVSIVAVGMWWAIACGLSWITGGMQ